MTMNENEKQAEPVAWRPILQHPIPWVTGKPQESDIRHWTSQDCEVEYAYAHPAQPVRPAVAVNEQMLEALKCVESELLMYRSKAQWENYRQQTLDIVAKAIAAAETQGCAT